MRFKPACSAKSSCVLAPFGVLLVLLVIFYSRIRDQSIVVLNENLRLLQYVSVHTDTDQMKGQLEADVRVLDDSPSSTALVPNIYISVRTTAKLYDTRMRLLRKTWFQKVDKEKFTIVSDYVNDSFPELKQFEQELSAEGFNLVVTNCSDLRRRKGMCCKSGIEFENFFNCVERHKSDRQPVQWYCHFDDDIYVNVKELSNLLSKYDSTKPHYIGKHPRERPFVVDSFRLERLHRQFNVNHRTFWYSAGATHCMSLALMEQLEKYFNGVEKFQHTCSIGEYTEDLTIGAVVGLVLGYNITHIDAMHSQGTDLIQWNTETLTKLVTVSYATIRKHGKLEVLSRIDPQPRIFTKVEDPTSIHQIRQTSLNHA